MKTLFAAAALIALAACSTTSIPGVTTGQNNCKVTLSGAISGTFNCVSAPTGGYDSNNNKAAIAVVVGNASSASNTAPNINIGIGWPGQMSTGTYHQSDTGAQGGAAVTGTSSASWLASSANGSNPAVGTYTLNLTGTDSIAGGASGAAYYVHGTVDGTLPAITNSGATGTVTLHATF
jgi:hypothetical protein